MYRAILEHIFVLDPNSRLTTNEILELLHEDTPPICIIYILKMRYLERDLNECKQKINTLTYDNMELKDKLNKLLTPSKTELAAEMVSGSALTALPKAATMNKDTVTQQVKAKAKVKPMAPPKLKFSALTKLMVAARGNNIDAVKFLIDNGVNIRSADSLGMTALMHAARTQSLEVIKMLIDLERCMHDHEGKTALIHAAITGRLTSATYLLEYEGKMCDKYGMTALMYAVIYGHKKLVKALKNV